MDCGPTCLRMITKYYGKAFALQTLREMSQIGKGGVNMLGISEAAEIIGLRTHALKIDYATLTSDALLPCILHWNQYHFVVLYKVSKKTLFIADPAAGLVKYTPNEFLQRWISDKNESGMGVGVALLLEPTPKFYENDEDSPSQERAISKLAFKNIFNYIIPYKKMILQLLLGLGVASILQLHSSYRCRCSGRRPGRRRGGWLWPGSGRWLRR
jgi:ATP-binding cassette subfamily B protein